MRKSAFTLIEVMVAASIVMVLSGITYSIMGPAREQSRQANCVSNLKQIYSVWAMYSADNQGGPTYPSTEMVWMPPSGWWDCYGEGPNEALTRCPDHTYQDRKGSYVWMMLTNITQNPPDQVVQQLLRELKEQGASAAAVHCSNHDRAYYAPKEQEVSNELRQRFLIQLKFDGSIKRGRVNRNGVITK